MWKGYAKLLLKVTQFNKDITKIMHLLHEHKAGKQHFYLIHGYYGLLNGKNVHVLSQ